MMDLGNPRIFVTYGKDRFGGSSTTFANNYYIRIAQ
jgi:hypothetical protein